MATLDIKLLEKILNSLNYHLCYFESCRSTMTPVDSYEWKDGDTPFDYVVITDNQTSGVGRAGAHWLSKSGVDLTFTVHKTLKTLPRQLSIYIGMILLNFLKEQYSLPIKFKWPNDLYLHDKKLCGILVQYSKVASSPENANDISSSSVRSNYIRCRIGIGVNVNSHYDDFISLKDMLGHDIDRNNLFCNLFYEIAKLLSDGNFRNLVLHNEDDYLYGKNISIYSGGRKCFGAYAGYSENGIILKESGYNSTIYNNASNIEIV